MGGVYYDYEGDFIFECFCYFCNFRCFRHFRHSAVSPCPAESNTVDSELPGIEEECEALGIAIEDIDQLSREEAQTPTSEECPDEDIVQSILGGKELETTIAEDSDESVAVFVPSFKQFLDAMETARAYIQSLTGIEEEITFCSN